MVFLCRERHCCLALEWRCSPDGIGSFLVKRNQLPSVSAKSFVMATRSRTSGGWFFLRPAWRVIHLQFTLQASCATLTSVSKSLRLGCSTYGMRLRIQEMLPIAGLEIFNWLV